MIVDGFDYDGPVGGHLVSRDHHGLDFVVLDCDCYYCQLQQNHDVFSDHDP